MQKETVTHQELEKMNVELDGDKCSVIYVPLAVTLIHKLSQVTGNHSQSRLT